MKLSPLMGRRAALGMMGAGLASASAMPLLAQEADAPDTTQTPVQTPVREVVEMVMGAADAPIELIEYASFTCPHCMRFHQTQARCGSSTARFILTGRACGPI